MKQVTRRTALAAIGSAGAGACMCGLEAGCATFTKVGKTPAIASEAYAVEDRRLRIDLGKVPDLAAVGGAVKIIDPKLPSSLIVARTAENVYAAVSLLCPHRGVEVEYRHAQHCFRCASLGHSTFGTDGALLKGFAHHGLTRYETLFDPTDARRLIVNV